ncbi:type II toxin-antitoxin system prevent-host-death family antitoxin [Asanoa sp. WMMD1127]|uniref:type II toxin-antitoxin system Phd/YefM family antitoxin n=1 Tax=Asanoa sp. WMMD1127 TaxID=3016107 RepID=UPI0024171668|nr:type II toxin-antitoxin system prevent-host-death family antitoxin [Asanoa sp. WMMD1127]MDG4823578.1 type II toxin-antitoxin system prevent-host-death family antitoxin [Asanoa sp. WMMD1127]
MSEPARITARDLSRHAGAVLTRVEHGERLTITRDGEPIAEIIPIDRSQRTMARWIRDGVVAPPPPEGYAKGSDLADAARRLGQAPPGRTANEALQEMREDERP